MMNRFKIMIVEDEPIIRLDLKEMLQNARYDVVAEARNGEQAVELAHRHRPDLVLMDVKMPVMNGIKASFIIRSFCDASIILLTAFSDKDIVEQACNVQAVAYLVKPVTEENLIPAVEIALRGRRRLQTLQEEIETVKGRYEEKKVVERAKGMLMLANRWSEADAHRWLQRESMNRQLSIKQLAVKVLQNDVPEGK